MRQGSKVNFKAYIHAENKSQRVIGNMLYVKYTFELDECAPKMHHRRRLIEQHARWYMTPTSNVLKFVEAKLEWQTPTLLWVFVTYRFTRGDCKLA